MRSLSRKTAYRKSTLRNLATSLILYENIKTTEAKAKEVFPIVERLILSAKRDLPKDSLRVRRNLLGYLFDKNAAKKVIEDLVPRYKKINTGIIKSYKLGPRLGDGAEMVILELQKGEKIELSTEEKVKENAKEKTEEGREPKENRRKAKPKTKAK